MKKKENIIEIAIIAATLKISVNLQARDIILKVKTGQQLYINGAKLSKNGNEF